MGMYQRSMQEEAGYLEKTVSLIKMELDAETAMLSEEKKKLMALGRAARENAGSFTGDFDRISDFSQYLPEMHYHSAHYGGTKKKLENYSKMVDSPYFGRFDFREDGCGPGEKIYIGLCSVMDSRTSEILVYDWRAPISGMFYSFEPGRAQYQAPMGPVSGEIRLKRQYKIERSRLKYFYDCSIAINDEMLQEVLGRNSSPRMRNIVETIQKEQDAVIRDTDSELLIVQGVAGSGKTSIALHRIAFLLYNGMGSKIRSGNFIIISPNALFSRYISGVLPDLGEGNVDQTTFDSIVSRLLGDRLKAETRNEQIESLVVSRVPGEADLKRQSMEFKGSREFARILDRLIRYYERKMIVFEDVYYDGRIIETRQRMRNVFLHRDPEYPMAGRLKRIESVVLDKIHPLQKKRHKKIEKIVAGSEGRDLEIRSFSRLLAIKEAGALMKRLRRFTEVDYLSLYRLLFTGPGLLEELACGIRLPGNIERIAEATREALEKGRVYHEDCAPLLYLRLKVEGCSMFSDIRHVFIDEAQDYYPMQYEVFRLLFRDARYTVLGDVNQAVEKDVDVSLYDVVSEILDREKAVRIFLNKSYRSSYEISRYTRGLLPGGSEFTPFERRGADPEVVFMDTGELVDRAIARDIERYLEEGYESVAVICKTRAQAEDTCGRLKGLTGVSLAGPDSGEIKKGALVIPSYMSKGLEFDVVLVPGASSDNYSSGLDRRLLYIAGTRALHRLAIYYTGEKSPFI